MEVSPGAGSSVSGGTRGRRPGKVADGPDVTDLGLCTFQSIEVDKRPDMKFRQGFTEAGAAVQGSKNKKWLPLLAPWILK